MYDGRTKTGGQLLDEMRIAGEFVRPLIRLHKTRGRHVVVAIPPSWALAAFSQTSSLSEKKCCQNHSKLDL